MRAIAGLRTFHQDCSAQQAVPEINGQSQRRHVIFRYLIAIAMLFGASVAFSQSLRQSFDLQVPWRPIPVLIGGKKFLVYELHLTNFASANLALRRIQVVDASGVALVDINDSELTGLIGRLDQPGAADRLLIPPGVRGLVYLSVPTAKLGAVPIALSHRIEYQVAAKADRFTVQGGTFAVNTEPPVSIGPPLRGGPWVAIYDPAWERGHRRVPYAVAGSVHIPGRFAIDWIKVDKHGKYFDGDGSNVKDWYGYGAEAVAVSDGTVVAVRDGMPEGAMILKNSARIEPEDASGNYVALDLGAGHFAFYEHLKPGSIRVKVNDHVRRGSVLGQLGYTGESTGPHLHFHISDNNSPLNAEGLPYELERFQVLGSYPSIETFARSQPWVPAPAGLHGESGGEFPPSFVVLNFPE